MPALAETHVVTCFLRNRGEVLLLRRSEDVGSYRGLWGAVAGHAEADPDAAARREIDEETGLADAVTLVRRGAPFTVDDADLGRRWIVHPYLFDCSRREPRLDWETTEAAWVAPPEILRRDTVPELWTSYAHVAPTVDAIRGDHEHGSAYLSLRALEVLRDRAAVLAHEGADPQSARTALRETARALLQARPAMSALANRIHRVMHACRETCSPDDVARAAHAAIGRALDADAGATRRAAALVAGRRVLTLSRSGTVIDALQLARPAPRVYVAASQPAGEGVDVAEALARAGRDVTLLADAALAAVVAEEGIQVVLVGADTVLPSGGVVNKTGTRVAALAAQAAGIPVYVVTAVDKVSVEETAVIEQGAPTDVYAGDAPLRVYNPTFEATPAHLVTGIVTEDDVLEPGDVHGLAGSLRALRDW